MARTDGFFVESNTATSIPDGGNLKLEVYDEQNSLMDTWPLSIENGLFTIDVPQSRTGALWPDRARIKVVATSADGATASRFIALNGSSLLIRGLPISTPELVGDGSILSDSTYELIWTDVYPNLNRKYDVFVDDVDSGAAVQEPVTTKTLTGLPTNGSNINIKLYWWEDGESRNVNQYVEIDVTAFDEASVTIVSATATGGLEGSI